MVADSDSVQAGASGPECDLAALLAEIRACIRCSDLPLGPAPVLQAGSKAQILIVGQAPGRRAHLSCKPFDDLSGDRLRQWLGIDRPTFYNPDQIAIAPMAFCFPGTGRSGDLPPPPLCAESWRNRLLGMLPSVELTLVLGQYALRWHLPGHSGSLTEACLQWRDHLPRMLVLPHPSPRNNRWLKANPWFESEVLPALRILVNTILAP